jgi:hypothetical protein
LGYRLNCWRADVITIDRPIHPCWVTPDLIRGAICKYHRRRFTPVLGAKSLYRFGYVAIDRCLGDAELAGDLFGDATLPHEAEALELARAERFGRL